MRAIYGFVGLIVVIVIYGLIASLPVWLLWNYCLLGAIDGIHEISWLQAWGILVLFSLLFKTTQTEKKE